MMRIRIPIFIVLLALSPAAFGRMAFEPKDETDEQMIARAESARPDDQPALYTEVARRKAAAVDKLYDQVLVELDPAKATMMWQQLNDLVINDYADIPLVDRKSTSAKSKGLTGPDLRAFDNETWNIGEWKKA